MPKKSLGWVAAVGFFLAFVGASTVRAQYTTGTVQGTVFDPNGGVVAGATVTLRNLNTNVAQTFKTGTDGVYLFAAVLPGPYEVSAEATGFSKVASQFTAAASKTTTQDLKMTIQSQTATVVVSAEAAAELNTSDPQLSTIRNSLEMNSLPTGHSATGLIATAPGVQPMYNPRGGSLVKLTGAQTGQISANGGRAEYNSTELDFTDANDWEFGGIAGGTTPYPDFVEQFNVLTSNVSAAYGIKSSGIVEIVTKSGTNNWHGEANDYIQNDFFNARNYNDKSGKPTRTDVNTYGFAIGGPAIKDKLWLFGGYNRNKQIGTGGT